MAKSFFLFLSLFLFLFSISGRFSFIFDYTLTWTPQNVITNLVFYFCIGFHSGVGLTHRQDASTVLVLDGCGV